MAASISACIESIERFIDGDLAGRLSSAEGQLRNATREACESINRKLSIDSELLGAASEIKRIASQINVVIHGLGIMHLLPQILEEDEQVEYVSLGAGNTGKKFDLETNKRIAEFKFINWRGGAEAIRQDNLLKDFFYLAEAPGSKRRFLYVVDSKYPLKFFNRNRKLTSVFAKQPALQQEFSNLYGERFVTVSQYFAYRKDSVQLVDVSDLISVPAVDGGPEELA
jgi:hypothetical protein